MAMAEVLTSRQRVEFVKRGFSRRDFHKIATLLTPGGALPFYNERALAQSAMGGPAPPDAVRIDANENPMGPCKEAAEAIHAIVQKGGRYLTEEYSKLAATLAEQEGLSPSYVQALAGSSDALHRTVLSFCGRDRPYVVADPGYEPGSRAAQIIGARVIRVPLVAGSFAHDVKRMAAAHSSTGVIYVCNPNNPTGTITSTEDIEWLVN
ncbi:MAG: aminotransferase class I/II-fold pyridoxal phosphate-dependent enzyme, partial [Planctomycetaceae bacterium]